MSINIKPKIIVSWIPNGKIILKPLFFATVIKLDKASADTLRKISATEKIQVDTIRKIKSLENVQVSTNRHLMKTENIAVDTKRKIEALENIQSDTLRRIRHGYIHLKPLIFASMIPNGRIIFKPKIFATVDPPEKISADTSRKIFNSEVIHADTLRQFKESISVDTERIIICTETFSGDLFRIIKSPQLETFSGDTCRKLVEKFSADTCRSIVKTEKIKVDTIRRKPYLLNYYIKEKNQSLRALKSANDDSQLLFNTLKDFGIVSLSLGLNEMTLSDTIQLESATHMNINEALRGKLFNYEFNFLVESTSHRDLVQTINGMYNQDELLYTQFYLKNNTIADSLSDDEKQKIIDDNETLKNYLDIAQSFQINGEEVTRKNFLDYFITANLPVSSIINYVAHSLGLKTNILMQDFHHKDFSNTLGSYVTYSDILSQLFSFTSSIPQYQVNCFIRGNTLNVIMRGYENKIYDITDLPHSRPTINKKLLRNLWNNVIDESNIDDDDNDNTFYFSGTLTDKGSRYTFFNGLLKNESHSNSYSEQPDNYSSLAEVTNFNSNQNIIYSYKAFDENLGLSNNNLLTLKYESGKLEIEGGNSNLAWYLSDKDETSINEQWNAFDPSDNSKTIHRNKTSYNYSTLNGDGVYLTSEYTTSIVEEYTTNNSGGYELDSKEIQITEVRHIPLGNGFYSTATYQDGIFQGSSISQGKPSQQVTQYTIDQVQQAFQISNLDDSDAAISKQDERTKLSAIVNTSFPIADDDIKNACIDAMIWLNRRIEETIDIDIYCEVVNGIAQIDHIVDFSERILLDGNEYYLVSNSINLTPREFVQKLSLIRWY